MADMENYAKIEFTNSVLADIFGKYSDSDALSSIVGDNGTITVKLEANSDTETPQTCEQVLSLMYSLFEINPETPLGKIYMAHQKDILSETIYQLPDVIESFGNIVVEVNTVEEISEGNKNTKNTVTTIKRTKN